MSNAIMKIEDITVGDEPVQTVNARDLHGFLEVKTRFGDWITRRIDEFGFVQGVDFIILKIETQYNQVDRIDYHITLDMVKELSMVERNEKGKEAMPTAIKPTCRMLYVRP